jgi:hypothetical protein
MDAMDEALAAALDDAIVAVEFIGQELEDWFVLVCAAYTEVTKESGDWQSFETKLRSAAKAKGMADAQVDEFFDVVEEQTADHFEVLKKMDELGTKLATEYADILARRAETETEEPEAAEDEAEAAEEPVAVATTVAEEPLPYDEAAWFRHLKEYDRYWDGQEVSWADFREQFLGRPTTVTQATDLIKYVEGGDKVARLAEYGITTYDPRDWWAYLEEANGRWDGAELTWPAFRSWFLKDAEARGVHRPAGILINHAEADPRRRVEALAEYGIAIREPGAEPGIALRLVDDVAMPALEQALIEVPAVAALPDEEIQAELLDVLNTSISELAS